MEKKGWYFKDEFVTLPPILYIHLPLSMASYSKGA